MKKNKKAFTILEIVVSISILGLIVTTLLMVYYSIYKLQTNVIWKNTLSKKAEFYILSELYNKLFIYDITTLEDAVYSILKTSFEKDNDLKNTIKLKQLGIYVENQIYFTPVKFSQESSKQLYKQYYKIEIAVDNLMTKKSFSTDVLIPVIFGEVAPPPAGSTPTSSGSPSLKDSIDF
jgi:hypothetical protein